MSKRILKRLEAAEAWCNENWYVILKYAMIALVVGATFWLFNFELTLRQEKNDKVIAERDATIASQEQMLADKQAEIDAQADQIRSLTRQLTPVTEDGVVAARMYEFYGYHSYDTAPAFETDEEFKEWCQEHCPEAVYPTTEWTAREVIASWTEQPEIWGRWGDNDYYYSGVYFCWTPDWAHCFILDAEYPYSMTDYETREHNELVSGWLVVDGVRVAMIDEETYDIDDPYEMLRQYQAGEWDGSPRRSHDGSTTVEVGVLYEGALSYEYEAWFYDESYDPEGMAWAEFAAKPWWFTKGVPEEILDAMPEHRRPDESETDWLAENRSIWSCLHTALYADLPVGVELGAEAAVRRGGGTTRTLDAEGVRIFRKGEQVRVWEFKDFNFDFEFRDGVSLLVGIEEVPDEFADCLFYLYDGEERLIALREDGSADVILTDIAPLTTRRDSEYWGFHGRQLMYWRLSPYTAYGKVTPIADEVRECDFSGLGLYTTAEGCYMIIYDDENSCYAGEYLGPESLEYYQQWYRTLTNGRSFRFVSSSW